jgi:hypothetical protein
MSGAVSCILSTSSSSPSSHEDQSVSESSTVSKTMVPRSLSIKLNEEQTGCGACQCLCLSQESRWDLRLFAVMYVRCERR